MAIRIKAGQTPRYGRITMPKGTFLSNPSTAADGGLGGSQGTNAPSIGGDNWQGSFWNPSSPADFWSGLKGFWNNLPGSKASTQLYNGAGQPIAGNNNTVSETWNGQTTTKQINTAQDSSGNQYTWNPQTNSFVRNQTSAFSPASPSNQLVGNTLGQGEISYTVLANMMRGSTLQQITQMMQDRGYTTSYKYGVGVVFTPTGNTQSAPAPQSPTGIYGQQQDVGKPYGKGTLYNNGVYVQEGTPTPGGQSQYAVTYNNPRAKYDKHGKYRMVDYVTKDSSGNFVHVYRQELRKVYNRNSMRARAANKENANKPAVAANDAAINQLVSFRANYG